ncbi:AzlC family ABC transporter permease [Cellulomonas endophytica]|uniref:AzlC family ABC transporter permease n=1 Tax=Cellulomonas endophytica TaxID=2494735 RepID=UPI001010F9BA|nr:AzlC family ABC transporter permease [Cellulomonas endophytica]
MPAARSDRDLLRDVALVCAADGVVAVAFGALAVTVGLPAWVPVVMSVVVFAGGAQLLVVGLLAAGAGPVAAALGGVLVNLRLLPLAFAVGDVLRGPAARRLLGSHLVTDESVAIALAQPDDRRRRTAFWAMGLGLFVVWNLGVLLGTLGGRALGDRAGELSAALGLDAAFPAVLLALVVPALRRPAVRRAALAGAAVALAASTVLPPGLPVLLALVGVLLALRSPEDARPGDAARGDVP